MSIGFANYGEYVTACKDQNRITGFRKLPNQITPQGVWFDCSMSAGNPIPQYYAATPLQSTGLYQSTDKGIFHGSNVSPLKKFIKLTSFTVNIATPLPMPIVICDYIMFYPFIDEGTTDEQFLTNSITLPRWSDGLGVRIMAISLGSRTGGQSFVVNYTNSNGVAGRLTTVCTQNSVSVNGNIVTSLNNGLGTSGPFLPLQSGDLGVRSIESVTMLGADVGLFALVLVKPLMTTQAVNVDAPVETETYIHRSVLPEVKDDAYINFICLPQGSLSAVPIFGYMEFIFN
jgi:hypothetical protein